MATSPKMASSAGREAEVDTAVSPTHRRGHRQIQLPWFTVDSTLNIGADAAALDSSLIFKTFLRPDVEAEYRRSRWEAWTGTNAVVFGVLVLAGLVMMILELDDAVAAAIVATMTVCLFSAFVRSVYVARSYEGWCLATRRRAALAQQWIFFVLMVVATASIIARNVYQGSNCRYRTDKMRFVAMEGRSHEVDQCVRVIHIDEVIGMLMMHKTVHNPVLTGAACLVFIILFAFGAALADRGWDTMSVASRQVMFAVVNVIMLIGIVTQELMARLQFRAVLRIEDTRRLHEEHRDRVAYVVRRALPARFAHRLSRTAATTPVLALSELFDHAADATLCATSVTGYNEWSTKQLQESGVVALHRLFTLFDDAARVFDVDFGCTYGDTFCVTTHLIKGSHHIREARVVMFALWQLHVQFGREDVDGNMSLFGGQSGPNSRSNRSGRSSIAFATDGEEDENGGLLPRMDSVAVDTPPVNVRLHSAILTGPLSGGMTGSRELRYFLSGATLRRALEVLPMVTAGQAWVAASTVEAIAKSSNPRARIPDLEKFDLARLDQMPPPCREARVNTKGLNIFYRASLKPGSGPPGRDQTSGSTRGGGVGANSSSSVPSASPRRGQAPLHTTTPRRYAGGGAMPLPGESDADDTVADDFTEAVVEVEPDLAEVAAALLGNEDLVAADANPLEPLHQSPTERSGGTPARSRRRGANLSNSGRDDKAEMATFVSRGTNLMSFVSKGHSDRSAAKPMLESCSGTMHDPQVEKLFLFYIERKVARWYAPIALAFVVFFVAAAVTLAGLRLAEEGHNGWRDIVAYVLAAIATAVSGTSGYKSRQYYRQLLKPRRREANIGTSMSEANASSNQGGRGLRRTNTIDPEGASPAGIEVSSNFEGETSSTAGDGVNDFDPDAHEIDELIFSENIKSPSSESAPWVSHQRLVALIMLQMILAYALLFLIEHNVVTNNPSYFFLCFSINVINIAVCKMTRLSAIVFVAVLVHVPCAAVYFYQSGINERTIAGAILLGMFFYFTASTVPSELRNAFHIAHFAHVSRDAALKHSDVLNALLRRVVPAHVVKRGAIAIDAERQLLLSEPQSAIDRLRSAQLGDRIPRDPAVVDDFPDLVVITVSLDPPVQGHGMGDLSTSFAPGVESAGRAQPFRRTSGDVVGSDSSPHHERSDVVSTTKSTVTFRTDAAPGNDVAVGLESRDIMERWTRVTEMLALTAGEYLEHVQSIGDTFVLAGPFDPQSTFADVQRSVFAGIMALTSFACDLRLAFTAVCSVDEATGALLGRNALRYGIFGVTVRQCREILEAIQPPPGYSATAGYFARSSTAAPQGGGASTATVQQPFLAGSSGGLPMQVQTPDGGRSTNSMSTASARGAAQPTTAGGAFVSPRLAVFGAEYNATAMATDGGPGTGGGLAPPVDVNSTSMAGVSTAGGAPFTSALVYCTRSFVAALAPSVAHDWSLRPNEKRSKAASSEATTVTAGGDVAAMSLSDGAAVDVKGFPSRDVFNEKPRRVAVKNLGTTYVWRLDVEAALDIANPEVLQELGMEHMEAAYRMVDAEGDEHYDEDEAFDDGDGVHSGFDEPGVAPRAFVADHPPPTLSLPRPMGSFHISSRERSAVVDDDGVAPGHSSSLQSAQDLSHSSPDGTSAVQP